VIQKRIHLVCVPWHALKYPSLALGILSGQVKEHCPNWQCDTTYLNIQWAEYLAEKTSGAIGVDEYSEIGEDKQRSAPGEWVFSNALHRTDEWQIDRYKETFVHGEELFRLVVLAHRFAPEFVDAAAEQLCAGEPDVIGLTSTFAQNIACLALARAIKLRAPQIKIVMGGANCDGSMGRAIHEEHSFVDFVVTGEGEDALVQLLEAIDGKREFSAVQNLTWRAADGSSVSNDQAATADISKLPPPNFDAYFDQFMASSLTGAVEPSLVLETSRGCWWGAKHHCTFCGLNGSTMAYRMKSPDNVIREIVHLVSRHQVLDVIMADNIIAMQSFEDLLPRLKDMDLDVRLQFEIKANLTTEQIALLRDSKVLHVQPGVESLSSHVLRLMEKGVNGAQNVYMLREMERHNITVSWNLLAGFPGEREADYEKMLAAFSSLIHLQAPIGVTRIMIQRFSPFFDKPWLGFEQKNPSPCFEVIYDRSSKVLEKMVYMFESQPQGVSDEIIDRMDSEIRSWRAAYRAGSALTHDVRDGCVHVADRRPGFGPAERALDATESAIYLAMDQPSRIGGIVRRVADLDVPRSQVDDILDRLRGWGLVFEDEGWWVSLSIGPQANRIREVHCTRPRELQEELVDA
jgi:magnesium-protoporphyrin IX monomethyl ester (oxidative) cyclase